MFIWARGASRVYHLFHDFYLDAGIGADTGRSLCGTAWTGDAGLLTLKDDVVNPRICKNCCKLVVVDHMLPEAIANELRRR